MTRRLLSTLTAALMLCGMQLPAQSPSLLTQPAAPPLGIVKGKTPDHFASPVVGPAVTCAEIERRVALLNPTLVAGEPLYLRFLLKSLDTQKKLEFMAQVSFGADLNAMIQPPDGKPYAYSGLKLGSNVPTAVIPMEGFTYFRSDLLIGVDENSVTGAAFDMPGTYRIRLVLNCVTKDAPPEPQDLGTFEVTVTEAAGDDQVALGILDDYTIFQAFHTQAARYGNRELLNGEQVRKLSRLVAEAPRARLRPHAMMILADYYEKNNDPAASRRLYNQVAQEYPSSPFEQTALQKLMNIALKETDRAAAQEIFLRQWSDPVLTQIIYPGGAGWDLFVKDNIPPAAGSQWMIQETPGPDPEILEHQGPRIMVSEEVQQQFGLPAEIIPNRAQ